MDKEGYKERSWPLLMIASASKKNIIHISRFNVDDGRVCGKVLTECGRAIHGCRTSFTPEEIENGPLHVSSIYREKTYTLCPHCGTKEDFVNAETEYRTKFAAYQEERAREDQEHMAKVAKTQSAMRSAIKAELLYGVSGIEDVEDQGWSFSFTHKGRRIRITLENPPDVKN